MKGIAFKVTYNDGGADSGLFGFRGICTKKQIFYNIEARRDQCCRDFSECWRYYDGQRRNQPKFSPGMETWCYEATVLLDQPWQFAAGFRHRGDRAGDPFTLKGVQPGDFAFLTTRLPGELDQEGERRIFAVYRVGEVTGSAEDERHSAVSDGTCDVLVPDDVVFKLWDYHANKSGGPRWNHGLFRNLSEETTRAMLEDLVARLGRRHDGEGLRAALAGERPQKNRLRVLQAKGARTKLPATGQPYRDARIPPGAPPILYQGDPAKRERGLWGHADTQNAYAAFLRGQGIDPLEPAAGDPDFDLAWVADGVLHVCEVKSLTPENEAAQLRLALGQVLEYRYRLAGRGKSVIAVIAVERPPRDPSWTEICGALEIPLVWPGAFRTH